MLKKNIYSAVHSWSAAASLLAGTLWLLIWLHQRAAHGRTATNEMRLILGFTWMDSAKFLVIPTLLLLVGVISLFQRRDQPGWLGGGGGIVTGIGLVFLTLGIAVEFWPFPWGSYAIRFEEAAISRIGGIIQSISSLVTTAGLSMFNIELVRAKVLPVWIAPVLVIGSLTTFFFNARELVTGPGMASTGHSPLGKDSPGPLMIFFHSVC